MPRIRYPRPNQTRWGCIAAILAVVALFLAAWAIYEPPEDRDKNGDYDGIERERDDPPPRPDGW